MDYIVWTRIIVPFALLIYVVYVIISANRLDKKITQRKLEAKYREKTPIVSNSIDPNNIEDFKGAALISEMAQHNKARSKADEIKMVEQKLAKKVDKMSASNKTPVTPPPVPVENPTRLPSKRLPATSLLELSHQTFREGIILSEILGRPKGLRGR